MTVLPEGPVYEIKLVANAQGLVDPPSKAPPTSTAIRRHHASILSKQCLKGVGFLEQNNSSNIRSFPVSRHLIRSRNHEFQEDSKLDGSVELESDFHDEGIGYGLLYQNGNNNRCATTSANSTAANSTSAALPAACLPSTTTANVPGANFFNSRGYSGVYAAGATLAAAQGGSLSTANSATVEQHGIKRNAAIGTGDIGNRVIRDFVGQAGKPIEASVGKFRRVDVMTQCDLIGISEELSQSDGSVFDKMTGVGVVNSGGLSDWRTMERHDVASQSERGLRIDSQLSNPS